MWLIIGGGLVALLLVVMVAVQVFGGGDEKTKNASNAAKAAKPSDAVRSYLTALAAGDADTALTFADKPSDTTFLTSEALKKAMAKAPLTDINVAESADVAFLVQATYSLGDTKVNEQFSVTHESGDWRLRDSYATASFTKARHDGISMMINGEEVKTDKVYLFPGTYEVTTDNTYITYGTENTLVVKSTEDYVSTFGLNLDLSPTGRTAAKAAVRNVLDTCVVSKLTAPPNCPWKVLPASGTTFVPGTVVWKYVKDPLVDVKFRLDYDDPTSASASFTADLRVDAQGMNNGSRVALYRNLYEFVKASIDLKKSPMVAKLSN